MKIYSFAIDKEIAALQELEKVRGSNTWIRQRLLELRLRKNQIKTTTIEVNTPAQYVRPVYKKLKTDALPSRLY